MKLKKTNHGDMFQKKSSRLHALLSPVIKAAMLNKGPQGQSSFLGQAMKAANT
jgi:hypothetical protein